MSFVDWAKEYPGAITICDSQGIIVYMNDKSGKVFAENGQSLIGKNVLECHPEPARGKLAELLATPVSNTYTIEKNGVKKMIHQTPWYQDGEYRGLIELSIEIPSVMPHYVRMPKAVP